MTYQSRLLRNIDSVLSTTSTTPDRSRLFCRKAIHFARLNRIEQAKATIADVRSTLNNVLDPISGTWILLSESVVGFFNHDLTYALDRVRRAEGIARAAKLKGDLAAACAWRSHLELRVENYQQTANLIIESLQLVESDDHFVHCRIALVAGEFFNIADMPVNAKRWMNVARSHATAEGDESSITAVLANHCQSRIGHAMLAHAFKSPLPNDYIQAIKEYESSFNFDSALSGAGIPEVSEGIRGHIHTINGDFEKAILTLEGAIQRESFAREICAHLADLTFCYLKTERLDLAADRAEAVLKLIESSIDDDTRAFIFARLSDYFYGIGNDIYGKKFSLQANEWLEKFLNTQVDIRKILLSLPEAQ